MTFLLNDSEEFADEAIDGAVAAHPEHLRRVHGGVVRAVPAPKGEVGVVIGGGSGHYPAFAGWVGPGIAHGSACGNIFASPSASQIYSVMKAAHRGAGLFVSFGNYAGDVLHFGTAAERLRSQGVDVRILTVTDDIASGPASDTSKRRGIAGDLAVFKVAGAAAAEGRDLDAVEAAARHANDNLRTLGVAFSGCTLPGADEPLFTVPHGMMSIGLGIHGEPGMREVPLPTADELAQILVDGVLAEATSDSQRITVLLNGLGTVKYEELFVVYRRVHHLLTERGFDIVQPLVGEQCTSLDMAGLSLSIMWLDDDLEQLWTAPCDTPALRRGQLSGTPSETVSAGDLEVDNSDADEAHEIGPASDASQAAAREAAEAFGAVLRTLTDNEGHLGRMDSIAGDGDHGIGMVRGARAAEAACREAVEAGAGVQTAVRAAGEAWAERAGGTSGALWGAAIEAVANRLSDQHAPTTDQVAELVRAGVDALEHLGGAVVGDKTMMDAAVPFRDTLLASTGSVTDAWQEALKAGHDAAIGTADLIARRGRSRAHAARSLGTPDPGAVSFVMVMAAVGGTVLGRDASPNDQAGEHIADQA